MPEWSIGAVSKTVVPLTGTQGSNPCLSANDAERQQTTRSTPNFALKDVKLGVFALSKKAPGNTESLRRFCYALWMNK